MSPKTLTMTGGLHDYILAHGVREHPALERLREETAELGEPARMQIAPEQGALIGLLVELSGARRVLEVGTFTGYSALAMALALPADGRLVACDVSEEWTSIGRRHWREAGVADRIDLRLGSALDTLDGLLAEGGADSFDMMFIDADKRNYDGYYERGLELVRAGGLIMVDNTLWSGRVADPGEIDESTAAMRAFNEKLGKDERIRVSIVPVGDGLTLALRR
jgi:predicted O-methyltransferase YrrM